MRRWLSTDLKRGWLVAMAVLALVLCGCEKAGDGPEGLRASAHALNNRLAAVRAATLEIRDAASDLFANPTRYDVPYKNGREYETYDGSLVYAKEEGGKSSVLGTGATPVKGETFARFKRLEHLTPSLMKVAGAHPDIVMSWFATAESLGIFYPPYDMVALVPPRLDVTKEIFPYRSAAEGNPAGSPVWLEPYIDMTGKGYMVTASVPLRNKSGETLGVAGCDVALEPLISSINDASFANRLLVSADSYVLAAGAKATAALGVESLGRVYYLRMVERDVPAPEKFRLDQSGDEKLAALGRRLKTFTGESTLPWGGKVLQLKAEKLPETGWLLVEVDVR